MRVKIHMEIPRYVVTYLDHRAMKEGYSRSDIIRCIIGLPVVRGSTGMVEGIGGGMGGDIRAGREFPMQGADD